MRNDSIPNSLFTANRKRVAQLMLPKSLAVVNANDILPTNADGSLRMKVNSDLFYLTGVDQEKSILVLYPDAYDESHREILFLLEPSSDLKLWEGDKLSKERAQQVTGIQNIQWLSTFPRLFHQLMCDCDHAYLNANEHRRAIVDVETREARFVRQCQQEFPLHDYQRLARLLHQVRAVKSEDEVALIRKACDITRLGFDRVLKMLKPGVTEYEVEAEYAHEFIRHQGSFAYEPIIASGKNGLALHYNANSDVCRKGELLLMDVASNHSNYNSDMTRTVPVSGKFTPRQKQVYNAVLRVMQQSVVNLTPGKSLKEWHKEALVMMEKELVDLKLLSKRSLKREPGKDSPAKKYFPHGLGHSIGLDVHDVAPIDATLQAGWVMTVEPGIYIPEEQIAVRIENTVLVGEKSNTDLMADIPIEASDIEAAMAR